MTFVDWDNAESIPHASGAFSPPERILAGSPLSLPLAACDVAVALVAAIALVVSGISVMSAALAALLLVAIHWRFGLYLTDDPAPSREAKGRVLATAAFAAAILCTETAFALLHHAPKSVATFVAAGVIVVCVFLVGFYAELAIRWAIGNRASDEQIPRDQSDVGHDASGSLSRRVKRAVDLTAALLLAIVVAPIVGIAAVLIKISDPGPAFFCQTRIGHGGRLFRMYKLRTMYCDAEQRLDKLFETSPEARREWDTHCKLSRDPRVLGGIGSFLRRSSLDEFPQLLNVIKGDMSLVGPRPFPAYHVERFDPAFQSLRASVVPGLTGLWQVSSRSNGNLHTQEIQDTYYIKNWSPWLDLFILLKTLPAALLAHGAH
ncbi:sugar transferase [Hyphomicrobium sp.]|uniref:sugar transferase n=1 Tax=Hyphomicrobium sp. TaxID=82 RepID=UPI003F6E61ED